MKTISKLYTKIAQANRYHNLLCNKYDHVRLIRSPFFGESGTYVWEVR